MISVGFPSATTAAQGSFNVTSRGLVQGQVWPDPAIRYKRAGGILASSETIPMWGGVGIYVDTPGQTVPGVSSNPSPALGSIVGRAVSLTDAAKPLNGFSVFEGGYAMVNSPSSPVPLAGSGGQVMYYRLGTGARIVVPCSPNFAEFAGDPITQPVSWDFVNQQLEPYTSTTVSSGTYNSTTGAVAITTAAAHGLNPGDTFELSSLTGTGGFASLDGEWTATAGTTGTTLNFVGPTGLGSTTLTGGTVASGGQLSVKVVDIQIGNCMTVNYNSGTVSASWNFNGNAAVIII